MEAALGSDTYSERRVVLHSLGNLLPYEVLEPLFIRERLLSALPKHGSKCLTELMLSRLLLRLLLWGLLM